MAYYGGQQLLPRQTIFRQLFGNTFGNAAPRTNVTNFNQPVQQQPTLFNNFLANSGFSNRVITNPTIPRGQQVNQSVQIQQQPTLYNQVFGNIFGNPNPVAPQTAGSNFNFFNAPTQTKPYSPFGAQPAAPSSNRNLLFCAAACLLAFVFVLLIVGVVLAFTLGAGGSTSQASQVTTTTSRPTQAPQSPTTQRISTTTTRAPTTTITTTTTRGTGTTTTTRATTTTPAPTFALVEGDIFGTGICGSRPVLSTRIIGGSVAQLGHWPWMGSLQTRGYHTCGAVLLNSRWAVTAAHCVNGNEEIADEVVFGVTTLSNDGSFAQRSSIRNVIDHFNYVDSEGTFDYDIALLYLTDTIQFDSYVRPLCFATTGEELTAYDNCYVTGWGALSEPPEGSSTDPDYPDVLQQVNLDLVDMATCENTYREVTTRQICAGGSNAGGMGSCVGDSGGPLACQLQGETSSADRWFLVGVVSSGLGCAQPDIPGIYTRISQLTDWIVDIVAQYS